MIQPWKKRMTKLVVCCVVLALMCSCTIEAGASPSCETSFECFVSESQARRWIGEYWKDTVEVVVAPASEMVEEIKETLDRTKPIYEVYKNGWKVDVPVEWQWYIRDLCEEYNLPERPIYGLILKESTFQPSLESFDGGCFGLAQIAPFWISRANITHFTDDFRSRDLNDPYDNLLTLAEMMCYARDVYNLDYSTELGCVKYIWWHGTGKSPAKITSWTPATRALGFADELVTLQF